MPHFNGSTSGVKIHTTRGGSCGKGTGCDYRANTTALPNGWEPWEAHHVLCFESVNSYGGLPDYSTVMTEIDDTYKLTDWCLNQPPNMIALPLKNTYRTIVASRGLNLPCHNVDHNCKEGYRAEVTKAFIADIWDPIKDAVENAANNNSHFTPQDVLSEITTLEGDFLAKIKARGIRSGGTQVAWGNQGNQATLWWMAFSMAEDAIAMLRPRLSL